MDSPRIPLARVFSLGLIFSAPLLLALLALVLADALALVPALLATGGCVLMQCLLFRPLVGDWMRVTAYLRHEAGWQEAPPPSPGLRFSDSARDVAVAARFVRLRARQHVARAEAETALQARLLHSLPDPLLVVNGQRSVIRANEAAQAVLGRAVEDRPLTAIIRDPGVLEAVDRVLEGAGRQNLTLVMSGAVERTFQIEVQPVTLPENDSLAALVILHDITALVRIEQMRADFVANASHELRTPLASILGFIETLRGPAKDDSEAHERFLAIMFQQACRMKRLIEDLLSLSRIELHEHTPPQGKVDLATVVHTLAEGLELQLADKEMPLQVITPDCAPLVVADADEMAQVIQNLLSNAVKYGAEGTPVTVRIEGPQPGPAQMPHSSRASCFVVHVQDQGEGIAREHLPRLTERFYRVDTARSRQMGGTGLGLAIVKHIVNRHRGALLIDSREGQGSTFSVYLPAAGSPAPAGSSPAPAGGAPGAASGGEGAPG